MQDVKPCVPVVPPCIGSLGLRRHLHLTSPSGTKRTSGYVRSSVASEGKADMARRPSLVANDRNGLQRMISSQRRLGPEISQSLHSPSAMRNLDLAKCQLGTKPPG